MLTIRMQRTGRKGHAMFRVVVQDSRQAPTSGKVVAHLGSYDPHAKTVVLDKEKATFYLEHGAQPSDRAAKLLKGEGVKLPKWVSEPTQKKREVRNPDKRRSTAPEKPAEEAAETPAPEAAAEEAPATETAEAPAEEAPAAESETADAAPSEEKPAEEASEQDAPADEAKPAEDTAEAEAATDSEESADDEKAEA